MSQATEKISPAGSTQAKTPHHFSPWKVVLVLILLAAIVAAVAIYGYLPRKQRELAANAAAKEEATGVPTVTALNVKVGPKDTDVLLPGSLSALVESSVYARASGYIRKRYVDIGDRVKAGQLLAEIETPDLDQQVAQGKAAVSQAQQQLGQAKAALVQAEAQRDLAKLTNDRYQNLAAKGAIARQDADNQASSLKSSNALVEAQTSNIKAAEENVRAAQASLERLIALQGYEQVKAPFAGVVTVRNIDTGSLISASGAGQGLAQTQSAGGSSTAGYELFRIAQVNILRAFVNVPQVNTPSIQTGMPAEVTLSEFPGRKFLGKVTRSANSLDPTSRTMLTEVQIPNSDGKLFPGMFVQIHFKNHLDKAPLLVPGDSVIVTNNGLQIALLLDNPGGAPSTKKVHLVPITLGRDFGAQSEVLSGLQGDELVVGIPGDDVREGAIVHPEIVSDKTGAAKK